MPVALLHPAAPRAFAPVPRRGARLGSAPDCDVLDASPGVRAHHALLRYVKGAWLLTAADGLRFEVGGEAHPMLVLRHGDELRLAPGAGRWTFRDRLAGAFVPPGHSLAAAWRAHPDFARGVHDSRRFGLAPPGAGPERACSARVQVGGEERFVKRLAPGRREGDDERHLALLTAVGGAPHPALAAVVDGGLEPAAGGVGRWLATLWVPGRTAREVVDAGGLPAARVLALLRALAGGLAHLHARGVVHRDVAPGNVVLGPAGPVLIDYGHAVLRGEPLAPSAGVVGTPGYVAPEEVLEGAAAVTPAVDVYGLAAVGYALLTGAPPAAGEDLLAALSSAARPPAPPREMGVEVPPALEAALLAALDPDPAARPDAAGFRAALEFAAAGGGTGGRP
jgi:serine/threonine-protein kinase